jgi:hypothetical protein
MLILCFSIVIKTILTIACFACLVTRTPLSAGLIIACLLVLLIESLATESQYLANTLSRKEPK